MRKLPPELLGIGTRYRLILCKTPQEVSSADEPAWGMWSELRCDIHLALCTMTGRPLPEFNILGNLHHEMMHMVLNDQGLLVFIRPGKEEQLVKCYSQAYVEVLAKNRMLCWPGEGRLR